MKQTKVFHWVCPNCLNRWTTKTLYPSGISKGEYNELSNEGVPCHSQNYSPACGKRHSICWCRPGGYPIMPDLEAALHIYKNWPVELVGKPNRECIPNLQTAYLPLFAGIEE